MEQLSAQALPELLRLDRETGRLYWMHPSKYHSEKAGAEAGTPIPNQSGKVYWRVSIQGRKYARSRIVFAMEHGRWPEPCVDHINGNSMDDRPENLREATVQQNAMNHKRRAKRANLPMGVKALPSGKLQARIAIHKIQHSLGTFDTPEAASAVYQAKRKEYFGEYA